jgi:hypothetical protein
MEPGILWNVELTMLPDVGFSIRAKWKHQRFPLSGTPGFTAQWMKYPLEIEKAIVGRNRICQISLALLPPINHQEV